MIKPNYVKFCMGKGKRLWFGKLTNQGKGFSLFPLVARFDVALVLVGKRLWFGKLTNQGKGFPLFPLPFTLLNIVIFISVGLLSSHKTIWQQVFDLQL
ncbi:hypothetical protein [Nostoc sp. DedQUE02]|uniref:hypothetical protein n=1 Tax=Nostoc sp. DedQUE02 TaxID=3075388 RepID=UPI002AD8A4C8|nr:hypothetical protein [Nostoc sp. DedQUE02]